ncbi:MAG: hypothetical protein LBV67_02160 [Streptococcaceae bacterium]|jgi:hypothetical protein|nr:hypothetical protein [Streptococcaceae bacterium]
MPEYKPKRRIAKFPAFDDNQGVKLTDNEEQEERVIFAGDDFLTNHKDEPIPVPEHFRGNTRVSSYDSVPVVEREPQQRFTLETNKYVKLDRRNIQHNFESFAHEGTYFEENPNNEVRRRPLPKKDPRVNRQVEPQRPKPWTFTRKHPTSLSKQEEQRIMEYRKELETERKLPLQQQYSRGLNRFKTRSEDMPPKLKRKVGQKAVTSNEELFESMKKADETYLLMDVPKNNNQEVQTKVPSSVARGPRTLETRNGALKIPTSNQQIRKSRPLEPNRLNQKDQPAFTGTPKVVIERKEEIDRKLAPKKQTNTKKKRLAKGLDGLLASEETSMNSIEHRLFERK